MARTPNQQRNGVIVGLRHQGLGPREIARRMGLEPGVVAGVLNRAGLTDRDGHSCRGNGHGPAFKRRVVERAVAESTSAAARTFRLSHSTVSRWKAALTGGEGAGA